MDFAQKGSILYVDNCAVTQLAEKYGTPLYVYSESVIRARCAALRQSFLNRWENTRAAYAAKAFCTPAILRLIEQEGLCVDVVSGGELAAAKAAGFPPERIEFNGNNKSAEELAAAVDYGIGRVIIDSPQELPLLEEICRTRGARMRVLYRVSPGVKADTHDYIVTGKKDSKFGLPLDDEIIYPAIQAALSSQYIEFLGLHFHLGSQLFDAAPYLEAMEVILGVMKGTWERFGYALQEINVGGGFGICYTDEPERTYDFFLTPVMERLEEFCQALGVPRPCVVTEPGRSIVGDAGLTLYTVGSIKEIPGIRTYVAVDGGMSDNIRPALYQAKYRAIAANKMDLPPEQTVTICGKCCESGDILVRDAKLPRLTRGDLLAIPDTGAYGYSMASNYNMIPIPAVVLVGQDEERLIVRRQSYEDLLRCAILPEAKA